MRLASAVHHRRGILCGLVQGVHLHIVQTQPLVTNRRTDREAHLIGSGHIAFEVDIAHLIGVGFALRHAACACHTAGHMELLPDFSVDTGLDRAGLQLIAVFGSKIDAHILHVRRLLQVHHIAIVLHLVAFAGKKGRRVSVNQCALAQLIISSFAHFVRRYIYSAECRQLREKYAEIAACERQCACLGLVVDQHHVLHFLTFRPSRAAHAVPILSVFAPLHSPFAQQCGINPHFSRREGLGKGQSDKIAGRHGHMHSVEVSFAVLLHHSRRNTRHAAHGLDRFSPFAEGLSTQSVLTEVIHERIEILLRRLALALAHTDATSQTFESIGRVIGVDIKVCHAIQLLHIFFPPHFGFVAFGHLNHLPRYAQHSMQFQEPRGKIVVQQALVFDRRILQSQHGFGGRQQPFDQLFHFVGFSRLETRNGLLHVFGIVPPEIRNDRLVGLLLFGAAEDSAEAGIPRLHIVERRVVPRIVSNRKKCRLRHFALLHRIRHDAQSMFELFGHLSVVVHRRHLKEIVVHI